jgi:hypothetical protein
VSAYEDAMAILQNRTKPTNISIPKPAQNINIAATSSSGHQAAAMASLNKPIPQANPYVAAPAAPAATKVD